MAILTDTEKANLLNKPGFLFYRAYGSADPYSAVRCVNGLKFDAKTEQIEQTFDDVGKTGKQVSDEMVDLSFDDGQVLDIDTLDILTGQLMTKNSVAGSIVNNHTMVKASGAWDYDTPMELEHQNGDGSKPVVDSVTGSVDGVLTVNVDYFIVEISDGVWAITVIDSTAVTTKTQSLTIQWDYTPNASTNWTKGGKKTITPIEIKYATEDVNGKDITYVFYYCFPDGNFAHGFSPADKAELVTVSLKLTAMLDTSRTAGDQLMKIDRET